MARKRRRRSSSATSVGTCTLDGISAERHSHFDENWTKPQKKQSKLAVIAVGAATMSPADSINGPPGGRGKIRLVNGKNAKQSRRSLRHAALNYC
jgi:hypothetical protein